MNRQLPIITAAALALSTLGASVHAEGQVDGFRTKLEKWVETRRLISEERTAWEADREDLKATRRLLQEQKSALEEEIAALEASTTAGDEERRDLQLQRGEYQRAARALATEITQLEAEVVALAPVLPEPLVAKLEALLVQIPEDPEATRQPLGQRLMSVLGILAQSEKFNDTATFVGETRSVGGGEKVRVRTLYWGLGQAVSVDARGRVAGVGRPGPEGWVFTDAPGLADEAGLLLDIYEGNVDTIEFVALPVEIQR